MSFSSLYIGILAATQHTNGHLWTVHVSVPFTSGSSLQLWRAGGVGPTRMVFQFPLHRDPRCNDKEDRLLNFREGFSSLYIGILAATKATIHGIPTRSLFQFPLHRDPRCNCGFIHGDGRQSDTFQFPLHRDPRCNTSVGLFSCSEILVSVPFTSGSSLQQFGMQ